MHFFKFVRPKDERLKNIRVAAKVTIPHRELGWIKDPYDKRDYEYSLEVHPSIEGLSDAVTGTIDNRRKFKPISNQLSFPSCVANSVADYTEAAIAMRKKKSIQSIPDLSRMFVWWNARHEMEPDKSKDDKSGTYNRLALDVAARFGIPAEAVWPYDDARVGRYIKSNVRARRSVSRPNLSSYRDAVKYKIHEFNPILVSGDKRLSLIVKALQKYPGVVAGFHLGSNFFDYKGEGASGVIRAPHDHKGNHSMIIVGYDSEKAAFIVRNHWGTGWGDDGYCYIHEGYIANSKLVRSLWVAK